MNTLEGKAVSPLIPPPRGWVETVPHGKATLDLENQGLALKLFRQWRGNLQERNLKEDRYRRVHV
ncbi:hypothetical protein [Plectonema phage Pbo-yong3]|uniref:hypothetical protein n=1 Tax=Plectonema phage Pbo-yong3 TaxID=2970324 RepID=UPI00403CD747|nr:hypothetical protein [Plectonema phage Pbo-yong3]